MEWTNKYPYTDFHELNLSWVIDIVKKLGIYTEDLEKQLNDFKNDTEAQLKIINDWINNYSDGWAKSVIEKYLATMIFVEISDSGYIVYYIPDTWEEIVFNTTDLDISVPDVEYGHLVLSY